MDDLDSLRICPECDCRLCFESGSEPLAPDTWLVVIQCPNCWHSWSRTLDDATLTLLEYALDDDMRVIAVAAEEFSYMNAVDYAKELAAEVARFAAALEAGAILPMDF